jgi:hypothetical protein
MPEPTIEYATHKPPRRGRTEEIVWVTVAVTFVSLTLIGIVVAFVIGLLMA